MAGGLGLPDVTYRTTCPIRENVSFTDGAFAFMMVIRKMARFTDKGDRFEEVIRKMGIFTDGRENIIAK